MIEKARDVAVDVGVNENFGLGVQLEKIVGVVQWAVLHLLFTAYFANKIRNVCSYADSGFDYLNCKKRKTCFDALSRADRPTSMWRFEQFHLQIEFFRGQSPSTFAFAPFARFFAAFIENCFIAIRYAIPQVYSMILNVDFFHIKTIYSKQTSVILMLLSLMHSHFSGVHSSTQVQPPFKTY